MPDTAGPIMQRFYWAGVSNDMLEHVPASNACQHLRNTLCQAYKRAALC